MAEETLKQIGQRLRGLREVLDIPEAEVAELCEVTLDHYRKIEDGDADPGVYRLSKIAKRYGIDLNVLLFGEEPRMNAYFVTRKGQGLSVNRRKDYKYQSLASGFRRRKVDPYLVTVDPLPGDENHSKNAHEGQEFDIIIEGVLEITIGEKVIILNPGDSIYFDSSEQHCMRAIGNEQCRFLCVVI
jgi:mannose-6-phosphate isomerase-like protein (cupin superfamily)